MKHERQFYQKENSMPNNGGVDAVRDYIRILVPVVLAGIGGYLVATGSANFQAFQDFALVVLTTYFGIDGVARLANKG